MKEMIQNSARLVQPLTRLDRVVAHAANAHSQSRFCWNRRKGACVKPRSQERVRVESVARLMVERGVRFDHRGLLVFPTLFGAYAEHERVLPPSAPIYSISLTYSFWPS